MKSFLEQMIANLTPESIPEFGARLLVSLLIVFTFWILHRLFLRALRTLQNNEIIPGMIGAYLQKWMKYLLSIIALFLILNNYGISLNLIWGILSAIAAMIAVGFVAVWSVISNMLCALLLIITKPFRIGDTVELMEISSEVSVSQGRVININMMYTTLQGKGRNTTVMIPNNLFFQKIIRTSQGKNTHDLEQQMMTKHSLLQTQNGTKTAQKPE